MNLEETESEGERENYSPAKWGKHYWKTLHFWAESYPDQPTYLQKEDAEQFILLIPSILPCETCRDHATQYIYNHDINPAVQSRDTLRKYLYNLHCWVNARLGKDSPSYETCLSTYQKELEEEKNAFCPCWFTSTLYFLGGVGLLSYLLSFDAGSIHNSKELKRKKR